MKVILGLAIVLFITSACHKRVKCPSDTFGKADIEQQNQKAEANY
ncbi:MAG: hypothetical protein ACPGLV_13030 [Bacteroidia bacterium]